jgi:hypothetical protein
MANKTELYGLRPVRQLNGSPFINAQNRYRIAADYGVSIYQGDLVEPTTRWYNCKTQWWNFWSSCGCF